MKVLFFSLASTAVASLLDNFYLPSVDQSCTFDTVTESTLCEDGHRQGAVEVRMPS